MTTFLASDCWGCDEACKNPLLGATEAVINMQQFSRVTSG